MDQPLRAFNIGRWCYVQQYTNDAEGAQRILARISDSLKQSEEYGIVYRALYEFYREWKPRFTQAELFSLFDQAQARMDPQSRAGIPLTDLLQSISGHIYSGNPEDREYATHVDNQEIDDAGRRYGWSG